MIDAKGEEPTKEQEFDQFILQEYQYYSDCFWRSEESGERKLNIYLTLVTAVLAGLFVFLSSPPETNDSIINEANVVILAILALLALLIFGLLTLQRIIKRNNDSDGYKKDMDRVREYFQGFASETQKKRYESYHFIKPRKVLTGGLADTIITLNSVISLAIFALAADGYSLPLIALSGITGFIVAFSCQFIYLLSQYRKSYSKLEKSSKNEETGNEEEKPCYKYVWGLIFSKREISFRMLTMSLIVVYLLAVLLGEEVLEIEEWTLAFIAVLLLVIWTIDFYCSLARYRVFRLKKIRLKQQEKKKS